MNNQKMNVVAEVTDDSVVRVKFEVPDVKNVLHVAGDQVTLDLPDAPTYSDYQEDYKDRIERFAALIGSGHDLSNTLETDWGRVYDHAASRGQVVLEALYESGVDTEDGLLVKYDDVEQGLQDEDYSIKGKTMPGIYRGINTKIRDHVTGVENADEARKILKRTWDDDGDKCRLLVKERDGRRHADAFKAAMDAKFR